ERRARLTSDRRCRPMFVPRAMYRASPRFSRGKHSLFAAPMATPGAQNGLPVSQSAKGDLASRQRKSDSSVELLAWPSTTSAQIGIEKGTKETKGRKRSLPDPAF